jgi:tripartite-type tricarboxylate transporter receptor subunit TctC
MSGELFKSMAGIDIVHVPYKGGSPMLVDLIGGQVSIGIDNLPSSMAFIKSGKVRAWRSQQPSVGRVPQRFQPWLRQACLVTTYRPGLG